MVVCGVIVPLVSPSWARYFSFAPKEKYPKERGPGCHALRVAAMLAETGGAGNSPSSGRLRQPAPSPGFGLRFSLVTERDHAHRGLKGTAWFATPRPNLVCLGPQLQSFTTAGARVCPVMPPRASQTNAGEARSCLSRPIGRRVLRAPHSARSTGIRRHPGGFSFGDFSLPKQRKVTRPGGRKNHYPPTKRIPTRSYLSLG